MRRVTFVKCQHVADLVKRDPYTIYMDVDTAEVYAGDKLIEDAEEYCRVYRSLVFGDMDNINEDEVELAFNELMKG